MKLAKLDNMVRGWFIGSFTPTAYTTGAAEVGIKNYPAGAQEGRHYHKIATEITVILSGRVLMNGREFGAGDIVTIEPNESCEFEALSETQTVVVKVPGETDDKYQGEPQC